MAAVEDQYFYEDEVYRIDKRGHIEFGMVLENSELVSSDENSDGEEGAGMKKGQIRVAWHPSGVEEVISEKKVIERYFCTLTALSVTLHLPSTSTCCPLLPHSIRNP